MSQDRWWERAPYADAEDIAHYADLNEQRKTNPLLALLDREVYRFGCPTDLGHRPVEMVMPTMADVIKRNGIPPIKVMCECAYLSGPAGTRYLALVVEMCQKAVARAEAAHHTHRSEWEDGYPPAPDMTDLGVVKADG